LIRPAALALVLFSTPAAASVPQMVHDRATAVLGARWAPVAVALARKESSFRCNAVGPPTRHGRARGVFQVMPGSARALGYDYAKLFNCGYGIEAGLAHMKLCIAYGVKTDRQMFSCHLRGVAGWR
jgi:hypothetical protein